MIFKFLIKLSSLIIQLANWIFQYLKVVGNEKEGG